MQGVLVKYVLCTSHGIFDVVFEKVSEKNWTEKQ